MADADVTLNGAVPGELEILATVRMQQADEFMSDQRTRGLTQQRQQRLVGPLDDAIGAHQPSRTRKQADSRLQVSIDRMKLSHDWHAFYQDHPLAEAVVSCGVAPRSEAAGGKCGPAKNAPSRRVALETSCGLGVAA